MRGDLAAAPILAVGVERRLARPFVPAAAAAAVASSILRLAAVEMMALTTMAATMPIATIGHGIFASPLRASVTVLIRVPR